MREQEIYSKALHLFDNDERKAVIFLELLNLSTDVHACKFPDVEMVLPEDNKTCKHNRKGLCFLNGPETIIKCSRENCFLGNLS